ncbi:MAG: extracellular solute-binding protein [Proteobacteria bacterium]|nr:extracellular solute-binding protein [Pseudomonadota bacterium]MBU6426010.1 extracellular solute-binding protein [Rhodospirillales bacterium]
MSVSRRLLLAAPLAVAAAGRASAAGAVTVAYAGSMGKLMDQGMNPSFGAATGVGVHGIPNGALALAHLITGGALKADVFVPVSAGPAKIVEAAGLASGKAVPVASTSMVLAYSPTSKFAAQFAAAKGADWTRIFQDPGFRLGRTDPTIDPQGQYVLFALQLAEAYYNLPGFARKVAGPMLNPAQVFAEPSLLARLEAGQIDATLGYKSAVVSQKLPFIELPDAVNLSNPALKAAYAKASLAVKGKIIHPSPLVFYAVALKGAANPKAAAAYVSFLAGPDGQAIFKRFGYGPGKGPSV